MRSCARMRATSSLSATHKRALVTVYLVLESGECGCRRVAVVFLHHNTILKKHWRASEDTPLPLSPSARQLCAAEPQTLAWYVRPLCAPRRALAVQPRRRRRVARFARARELASVDQRHRIGSRRRPSCAGLAQTRSRRLGGGRVPGRSDRWTVPGRHPSIKSELAEPGHRGASQDILVERLARGRPRLRVRIRCVQRALRRSTHRIPCWRPRPSHTRPTPTSRASVLPEVTTAGSRRRQAAAELESRHANRLSHQTLRNSRSLESSRGVGWGYTRQPSGLRRLVVRTKT